MNNYYKIYSQRMNSRYENHIRKKYAVFINEIVKSAPEYAILAEMGCGAANISAAVASLRPDIKFHYLIDRCPLMLGLSINTILKVSPRFKTIQHDIRNPISLEVRPDIIHSHGVLEHLSDADIIRTIGAQIKNCNKLIHFVPSAKYEKPSFGDERLMTPEQWRSIASPDSIVEFNDGYDLMLIWDKHEDRQ